MDSCLALQYLKAMGITSWMPRDEVVNDGAAGGIRMQAVPEPASARSMDVVEYLEHLSQVKTSSLTAGDGELMIAIEPPALASADRSLLEKMLAAIDMDLRGQYCGAISEEGDKSLTDQLNEQQANLLLIMICCNNVPAAIESYRARHHHPHWCSVPIAFTHHPAELNQFPDLKRPAWEDLKRVKAVLHG